MDSPVFHRSTENLLEGEGNDNENQEVNDSEEQEVNYREEQEVNYSEVQAQENHSQDPFHNNVPELKTYKRRWYILFVFSLMACHQCTVWNTWGPIASAVQFSYGWSDGTVAMMANWGTILFLLCSAPLSWFIEAKGLRPTVLVVSGLMMIGATVRCVNLLVKNRKLFLASAHICAILNGIAGVTVMAAPPLISSLWFPQTERTTATAINQAANMLGNGVAMLLGPALVHSPSNSSGPDHNSTNAEMIEKEIDRYMQLDGGIAVVIFLLFLVYYPSKPAIPPAPTSIIERISFKRGLIALVTNRDILFSCFAYSLSQGVTGAWMSVMVLNLRYLGISDKEVGYIGLASVIGQCIFSMLVGFFTDKLRNNMKASLVVLLGLASLLFIWLMLMCLQVIPYSTLYLYLAVISATSINYGCCPLFFELCVEIAYPVNESLVGGFLTTANNLVGMLFLFVFFIPNIGSEWINYVLVASTVLSIPAVLLTRERYNRRTVDEMVTGERH